MITNKAKMSLNFGLLTLAFCLSIVDHAYGAQPRITPSSLSHMLQQPTVTAIHRDGTGILWIGTQQGLHRFDGANLTVFNTDRNSKNWIPDSEIVELDPATKTTPSTPFSTSLRVELYFTWPGTV